MNTNPDRITLSVAYVDDGQTVVTETSVASIGTSMTASLEDRCARSLTMKFDFSDVAVGDCARAD